MFVAGLSGNFEPCDALKYHMNLDTVPKPNDWNIVAQLNKLPNSFMVFIRAELYEYFLHSKRPTPINNATEQFIQSGIGLVHVEASNKIKIIISEPLICLTLFTIVNEPYAKTTPGKPAEMQAPLYEHLVQHIQQTSSDVNRFEDLLAYYFSLAFEEPRALQEVFNITSDGNHALGSYCAQLVTSTRVLPASDGGAIEVEGVHRFASLHRPTSSGTDQPRYAGPLGYRAVDDSTQKVWGTHLFQAHSLDSPAPILFPGHHMGPDLLFLLRLYPPINPSKISYLWVAVQAKLCHVRDQTQVPIATVRSAIRSVTPKNFFMTKDGEWCSGFEPHSKTMKGLEDGLPGPPTFGTGRYHLLRVLCGYPAVVGPLDPADILDDGKHPIATLNVDQFIHITKDHPPEDTLSFYQDDRYRRSKE
ncbi:hypothetical protein BDZ89DRAFT_1146679 [Hymenopellis radicata]|nr:hypothetical protein BDZ89DRAFT_1146679 [Hymenopellis radicata]